MHEAMRTEQVSTSTAFIQILCMNSRVDHPNLPSIVCPHTSRTTSSSRHQDRKIWSQKRQDANIGETKREYSTAETRFLPTGKTSIKAVYLTIYRFDSFLPIYAACMYLATVLVSVCQPFHLSVLSICLIIFLIFLLCYIVLSGYLSDCRSS